MTIRHKHESTTTGTGSTITISTPTGFSNDVTTIIPTRDNFSSGTSTNNYAYVLEDGNGTDWEYGYGKVSGTTFYRDHIIDSTNSGNRINLSANTHTVYVPIGGLANRVAQLHVKATNASITTATGSNLSMSIQSTGTSVDQFPEYAAPTSPATSFDAETILKYSRGYTVTAYAQGYSGTAGYAYMRIKADGNYYSYLDTGRGSFRLSTSSSIQHGATIKTPMIAHGSPFLANVNDGWYPGNVGLYVYNDSGGTATITGGLLIDWYFG